MNEVRTKTIIHLRSGKKLSYLADGTESEVRNRWRNYIGTDDGSVTFGRYVIPKREIEYVECR